MPRILEFIYETSIRFAANRSGNVAFTFALCLVPLLAAVGTAIDYATATQMRTELQAALDAAVLAGAKETSTSQKIAKATDFFRSLMPAQQSNTPSANFSVDSKTGALTGTVQADAGTTFLGIFGQSSIPVAANATAIASTAKANVCILLVNPSRSQAFLVNSDANLQAPNCEIHVRSTSSPAAIFNAGSTLNVKRVCVKGSNVTKNGGTNPPAETNCAAISDPFASSMPVVTVGACTHNNQVFNPGNVTINPGVYCGWTNFNGSGTLTLNPGLYIIKNGGMTFNSGWTVNGTGVTFYLVDQNATLTFNGNVNAKLAAPTSGTYANILMFEYPNLPNTDLPINGSSGSSLQGLLYLPSRDVTINSVSSVSTDKVTMVFSTLIFNSLNWKFETGAMTMSTTGSNAGVRLTN